MTIKVGKQEEEKPAENKATQDVDMIETGVVDSENPYLYDVSGAFKKPVNYGEIPLTDNVEDYDINT